MYNQIFPVPVRHNAFLLLPLHKSQIVMFETLPTKNFTTQFFQIITIGNDDMNEICRKRSPYVANKGKILMYNLFKFYKWKVKSLFHDKMCWPVCFLICFWSRYLICQIMWEKFKSYNRHVQKVSEFVNFIVACLEFSVLILCTHKGSK